MTIAFVLFIGWLAKKFRRVGDVLEWFGQNMLCSHPLRSFSYSPGNEFDGSYRCGKCGRTWVSPPPFKGTFRFGGDTYCLDGEGGVKVWSGGSARSSLRDLLIEEGINYDDD